MLLITPAPVVTLSGQSGPTDDRSQTVTGSAFDDPDHSATLAGCDVSVSVGTMVVGTATVAVDGSWSTEIVLPNLGTNDLVASVTDPSGRTASSSVLTYDLETVLSPPSAVGGTGYVDNPAASHLVVKPSATVSVHQANETFVFRPRPGHVVIDGLDEAARLHDTLSFSARSFSSIVDILHHTTVSPMGATIHVSPVDAVNLPSVTFNELRVQHGLLKLHA